MTRRRHFADAAARPCAPPRGDLNEAKVRRESAAAKIGAHFRGTRTRSVVGQKRGERQFMEAQEKSGILEKRSARKSFIMGSRQIVLWQRRYVRIDNFHFCYSSKVPKVRAAARGQSATGALDPA